MRTCKSFGAVEQVSLQVLLQLGRHALQDVGFEALLVLSVGRERWHRHQLRRKARLVRFEVGVVKLVIQQQVDLACSVVGLLLFTQLPRLGDRLRERAQPRHRRCRAPKGANHGGGGRQGQDGAVADAPQRAGIDHVCGQRRLESVHDGLEFIIGDEARRDRRLVDGHSGGSNAGSVHRLPDGT